MGSVKELWSFSNESEDEIQGFTKVLCSCSCSCSDGTMIRVLHIPRPRIRRREQHSKPTLVPSNCLVLDIPPRWVRNCETDTRHQRGETVLRSSTSLWCDNGLQVSKWYKQPRTKDFRISLVIGYRLPYHNNIEHSYNFQDRVSPPPKGLSRPVKMCDQGKLFSVPG